jgi:hypothetical protein
MSNLDGLVKVAKAIFNIFLLFFQLLTVAAYAVMVNSKEDLKEISSSLYPNSDFLMNSQIAEYMLSSPVLWAFVVVFIFSVIKEFYLKDKKLKIILNVGILLVMACFCAMGLYFIYSPILRMS